MSVFFLITANGLWKACLISVLLSEMYYKAIYSRYLPPLSVTVTKDQPIHCRCKLTVDSVFLSVTRQNLD